jgi:hypothetical protein
MTLIHVFLLQTVPGTPAIINHRPEYQKKYQPAEPRGPFLASLWIHVMFAIKPSFSNERSDLDMFWSSRMDQKMLERASTMEGNNERSHRFILNNLSGPISPTGHCHEDAW